MNRIVSSTRHRLLRDRVTFRFVSSISGFRPSPSTTTRVSVSSDQGKRTFRDPNSNS